LVKQIKKALKALEKKKEARVAELERLNN